MLPKAYKEREDTKILTDNKSNIILTGFMGSGKTSVGNQLARLLGFGFIDTDTLIEEQEKESISSIFENRGEEYFRELETKLLSGLRDSLKSCVLSTGGGLPLLKENRDMLKEMGFVVYLEASPDELKRRLSQDESRPLLKKIQSDEAFAGMLNVRAPVYEEFADFKILTDGKTPLQLAKIIIKEYEKR